MKIGQIMNAARSLQALSNIRLPAKVAYRIGKAMSLTEQEMRHYETARINLVKLHGEPTEDGDVSVKPGTPNMEAFQKDHAELLDIELVMPNLLPITLEDLGDCQIEATHLAALDGWMIVEPA